MGSLNFLTRKAFRDSPPVELTEQEQFVFLSGFSSTVFKVATLSEQDKVTGIGRKFFTQKYRF